MNTYQCFIYYQALRTLFICNDIKAIYSEHLLMPKNIATIFDSRHNNKIIQVFSVECINKFGRYQKFSAKVPHNLSEIFQSTLFSVFAIHGNSRMQFTFCLALVDVLYYNILYFKVLIFIILFFPALECKILPYNTIKQITSFYVVNFVGCFI